MITSHTREESQAAVFGYAGINNSSSMYYYDNLDYTMRNADEILAMWEGSGR